jgi:hypothetical protein
VGEDKHYICSSGAEFIISSDAEKFARATSSGMRNYVALRAQESNDRVVLTINVVEGCPDPIAPLILGFKSRSELAE